MVSYKIYLWLTVFLVHSHIKSTVLSAAETCSKTDNYKVVTEILSYENTGQINASSQADSATNGLFRFLVYLDLYDPDSPQELVVNEIRYTEIFRTAETSITFMPVQAGGKLITKDSCGKKFEGANLRVIITSDNVDGIDSPVNTMVNSFSCSVPAATEPSPLNEDSHWSDMTLCQPALHKDSMELTFRYKVKEVPPSQCCLS